MNRFAHSIPTAFAATALAALTLLAPRAAQAACSPATIAASDIPTWKPPQIAQGACTQTEANKFEVAFNASSATPDSMEGSVSAGCKACIFSQDATAATWQIIVWTNRTNNEGIYNTAACLQAAGASQGCAGARYGADTCAFDACSACTDQTSFESCNSSARGGECKSYADEATSNCGSSTSAAFTACGIDPSDGTGSGVAKLVMQVCGGTSGAGGGTGTPPANPGSSNSGSSNNNSNSGDPGDNGSSDNSSNQNGTNGSSSNNGSGGGAMSSLQLDGPPNTAGGCSASGASSASAQPFALALVGLLVAARRKRSARNATKA
jgi:hypothetical protein